MEKLLNRCLRKGPTRRAQSMADVQVALLELKEDSESGRLYEALPARQKRWFGWRELKSWAAAGLVGLAIAAVVVWSNDRAKPTVPQTIVPLTTYPGWELYPSFSPAGNLSLCPSWRCGGLPARRSPLFASLLDHRSDKPKLLIRRWRPFPSGPRRLGA